MQSMATLKIDTKTIIPLVFTVLTAAFGWVFNSIEEIKSHQNACDTMVEQLDSELGLKKGTISPQSDLDLAWIMQYAQGEETADLQGVEVFEFLAVLALKEKP